MSDRPSVVRGSFGVQAWCVCVVVLVASSVVQAQSGAFPPVRVYGQPPAVSQIGHWATIRGGQDTLLASASLGLLDVRLYREQLRTVFPVSRNHYPLDSLLRVVRDRASDWLDRIRAVPGASPQRNTERGRERVAHAELAAAAGEDSLARRLCDEEVAFTQASPARRSYALLSCIAVFADPLQDSARLVRNLVVAERYLAILRTLPRSGYPTRNDSTSVLERQWQAEDTLVVAYGEARNAEQVLAHAQHVVSYAPAVAIEERVVPFIMAHAHVVGALADTPAGRARIAAFDTQLLRAVANSGDALPSNADEARRQGARQLHVTVEKIVAETSGWLALLDQPAPPIMAHVWLAGTDSTYHETPARHTLADGRVHVLLFGSVTLEGRDGYDKLSVADRLQREFGSAIDVIFVTRTVGWAGPDILGTSDEVAWLTRYFSGVRRVNVPVALWAGISRAVATVPEGHHAVYRPESSPNDDRYRADALGTSCVVIDQRGVVRFYQNVLPRNAPEVGRRREDVLRRRIHLLIDEPNPTRARS